MGKVSGYQQNKAKSIDIHATSSTPPSKTRSIQNARGIIKAYRHSRTCAVVVSSSSSAPTPASDIDAAASLTTCFLVRARGRGPRLGGFCDSSPSLQTDLDLPGAPLARLGGFCESSPSLQTDMSTSSSLIVAMNLNGRFGMRDLVSVFFVLGVSGCGGGVLSFESASRTGFVGVADGVQGSDPRVVVSLRVAVLRGIVVNERGVVVRRKPISPQLANGDVGSFRP